MLESQGDPGEQMPALSAGALGHETQLWRQNVFVLGKGSHGPGVLRRNSKPSLAASLHGARTTSVGPPDASCVQSPFLGGPAELSGALVLTSLLFSHLKVNLPFPKAVL